MKMIILNNDELEKLEALNSENQHLHRAIQAIKIEEGKHAVNVDILSDQTTWGNWIDFLQNKPTEDVDLPALLEENLKDLEG
jgi:hypothetical protein